MSTELVSKDVIKAMVGTRLPAGDWVEVTQERINAFADCTEDHQFIHVDADAASKTPFGGTIAHGFLTLSLVTRLCEGAMPLPEGIVMGINYGCDKVRFLNPVRAGKRVRAVIEVLQVDEKDANRMLVKNGITVEIEGETNPALYAEWLSMFFTQ